MHVKTKSSNTICLWIEQSQVDYSCDSKISVFICVSCVVTDVG